MICLLICARQQLTRLSFFVSAFIIKKNVQWFLMQVLNEVLHARHSRRPAGHWAVMKARLAGVDLFVMVYSWSQQRTCYAVSTCGKTVRHATNYRSKYADAYDNTSANELPRPAVLHQLFHFLPLIDETNKERQNSLALEKKWPTKNCWTRVIT